MLWQSMLHYQFFFSLELCINARLLQVARLKSVPWISKKIKSKLVVSKKKKNEILVVFQDLDCLFGDSWCKLSWSAKVYLLFR